VIDPVLADIRGHSASGGYALLDRPARRRELNAVPSGADTIIWQVVRL